jgi:hypothetical protein
MRSWPDVAFWSSRSRTGLSNESFSFGSTSQPEQLYGPLGCFTSSLAGKFRRSHRCLLMNNREEVSERQCVCWNCSNTMLVLRRHSVEMQLHGFTPLSFSFVALTWARMRQWKRIILMRCALTKTYALKKLESVKRKYANYFWRSKLAEDPSDVSTYTIYADTMVQQMSKYSKMAGLEEGYVGADFLSTPDIALVVCGCNSKCKTKSCVCHVLKKACSFECHEQDANSYKTCGNKNAALVGGRSGFAATPPPTAAT